MAVPLLPRIARKEAKRKCHGVRYICIKARLLCNAHMAVPLLPRKAVMKRVRRGRCVCYVHPLRQVKANLFCDLQMVVPFLTREVVKKQFKRIQGIGSDKKTSLARKFRFIVCNVSKLELLAMHNKTYCTEVTHKDFSHHGSAHCLQCLPRKSNWRTAKTIDSHVRQNSRGCTLLPRTGHCTLEKTREYLPKQFKKFVVQSVSELELLMMHESNYLGMDRVEESSGVHSLGKGLLGLDKAVHCGLSVDTKSKANRYFAFSECIEYVGNSAVPVESAATVEIQQLKASYVGIENHGVTCYMNSVLQSLYHIPFLRKAVYEIPTADMASENISQHLQALFCKLQQNCSSVSTKELVKSLGWDTSEHEDIQEKNLDLLDKLEALMKGTKAEGTIQKLFQGHHTTRIECTHVDCPSQSSGSFYDLQLDVKGCKDIYASFDKYVERESLTGDRKHDTKEFGKQDAQKTMLFTDFPPVLQLHLKRFEYDKIGRTAVKINDYYKFPLKLDLDRDGGKYLSPDADKRVQNVYTLHSVLVHSGGAHHGHYYAFIRPTLSDKWFKFDDEHVTEVDAKCALNDQYGGQKDMFSNAYMLVYIRESEKGEIICNVDEKHLPKNFQVKLEKYDKEKKHLEKEKDLPENFEVIMKKYSEEKKQPEEQKDEDHLGGASYQVVIDIQHPPNGGPNYSVRIFLKRVFRFDKMMDLLFVFRSVNP